jgi:hypothetical protein
MSQQGIPLDRKPNPGICDCEFDMTGDPDSYHFLRECRACGERWYTLNCPHSNRRYECPRCKTLTTVIPEIEPEHQ